MTTQPSDPLAAERERELRRMGLAKIVRRTIKARDGDDVADSVNEIAVADAILEHLSTTPPMAASSGVEPVKLVLFCPACGVQHIDAAENDGSVYVDGLETRWDNPPHRSHLCHGCGHIWRPADVPTEGVASIETAGKRDSPKAPPSPASGVEPVAWTHTKWTGDLIDALRVIARPDKGMKFATDGSRAHFEIHGENARQVNWIVRHASEIADEVEKQVFTPPPLVGVAAVSAEGQSRVDALEAIMAEAAADLLIAKADANSSIAIIRRSGIDRIGMVVKALAQASKGGAS